MTHQYLKGSRFKIVKEGCSLGGLTPIDGGYRGWGKKLNVGDILTCAGVAMTFGDGVPTVKWLDENGQWMARDCEFHPAIGSRFFCEPDGSFLEEVR